MLLSFLRNRLSFLAVVFCLMGTLAANTSLGNDGFQENNPEYAGLFSYLEGKGGSGEERIVETMIETDYLQIRTKEDGYASWMKMPIAGTPFADETNPDRYYPESYYEEETENDSAASGGGEMTDSCLLASVQENSLVATSTYYSDDDEYLRSAIVKYVVKSGDTPSSIAYSFGVSTNTVLWANDLNYSSYIKPEQELSIPPVTGVLHKVKETDTMEKIAAEYKTDAKLAIFYNTLPADGNLENKIGKIIIIPNGVSPKPLQPAVTTTNQRMVTSYSKYRYVPAVTNQKGHRFPWGYCTWYVATKRHVPWGGHAKSWLTNAAAYGYKVDKTPSKGAIVVTTEHRWYGHVAYVEAVNGNVMTISEMNYVGFGIRSVRTLSVNSRVIRGYVH